MRFRLYNCRVSFALYSNERIAILLTDRETGEPIAKATVNITSVEIGKNRVIIKNYRDNIGIYQALRDNGYIKDVEAYVDIGRFDTGYICELTDKSLKECG